MNALQKSLALARIGIVRPAEFLDRVEAIITTKLDILFRQDRDQSIQDIENAYTDIEKIFGTPVNWEGVDKIEHEVQHKMIHLREIAPFTTMHHADFCLAKMIYALCRLLKPEIVVETGVAYGVTTAFILQAMESNQTGRLISIDLPPLGKNSDAFVGFLVPDRLRARWQLYRGTSKRLLPVLLPQLGMINLFVHDSLHTYWNIRRELNLIAPYLSRPSAVVVDDADDNRAFIEWVNRIKPSHALSFRQSLKRNVGGVAIFS